MPAVTVERELAMQTIIRVFGMFRQWVLVLGPYAMLEIVLPGGTLLALLLFLCRRSARNGFFRVSAAPDVEFGPARTTTGERMLNGRIP